MAQSASSAPASLYNKAIGSQSHLYNGTGFQELPIYENEHPFFSSPEPSEGRITYHGQTYSPVTIYYNLVTDQIVTEDRSSGQPIQLIKEGIEEFTAFGHQFIQIKNDRSLANGFYDLIYKGQSNVLVRREKSLQHKVRDNISRPWYQVKERIFIGSPGAYQSIKSKKAVWQILGTKKDMVRRQLRQQHIKYYANKEFFCSEAIRLSESINLN
jgi:hypothetical protein